jgi:hypothetical protein
MLKRYHIGGATAAGALRFFSGYLRGK